MERTVEDDVRHRSTSTGTGRPRWFTTAHMHQPDELAAELQQAGVAGGGAPGHRGARLTHRRCGSMTFVGRQEQVRELAELLASARPLTLTGRAGWGTSRLALRAAGGLSSRFRDGVFLVEPADSPTRRSWPGRCSQSWR